MRSALGVGAIVTLLILSFVMTVGVVGAASPYPLAPSTEVIQDALDYLRGQQAADGSIGSYADSGWACIAIAAAGEDPHDWNQGGDSVVDFLRDNPDYSGAFNLATAYARTILVAVAAGEDPSSFGTYTSGTVVNGDFVQGLKDLYNGTQFEDGFGSTDLLNDDMWAVRALLAAGESRTSDEMSGALAFIAANQDANGGWSWAVPGHAWYGTSVDDTAVAILVLLNGGYSPDSPVIQRGLDYLKSLQQGGGGFLYDANAWSYDNVSSTSWAVNAIGAARQSPTAAKWTVGGDTPIDYLLGQQQPDGRFPYRDPLPAGYSELPVQNTAWAIEALVGAHYRASTERVVVGGVAERVDIVSLLAPWCVVVAVLVVLVGRRVRRDGLEEGENELPHV